jgi:hypothetical protein
MARAYDGRPSDSACTAREIAALPFHRVLRLAGRIAADVIVAVRAGQRRADFARRQRRHLHDFELRRRVAQEPQRTRRVPRRQHEAVAARRERAEQIAQHAAQAGEALERAQLEIHPAERRGSRRTRAPSRTSGRHGCAGARLGSGGRAVRMSGERRRLAQRLQEPLGRRRDPLDVHVLRLGAPDQIAQPEQQRCPAAPAPAEHDRNARTRSRRAVERGEHAPLQGVTLRDHHL